MLIHGGRPAGAFVTNTAIEDSAGDGITRGWTGEPLDFLPTNTFARVARCNQTFLKPAQGVCPSPTECPR